MSASSSRVTNYNSSKDNSKLNYSPLGGHNREMTAQVRENTAAIDHKRKTADHFHNK